MDYICLYISAKILRHTVSAKRFVSASAIGGLYSVAALFFEINSIIAFIIDALVCLIMITICFYKRGDSKKYLLASALLYIGISMLMGGVMTAIFNLLNKLELDLGNIGDDGSNTYIFAAIAVISAILSMKGISLITRKNRHREYFINLTVDGKSCTLQGFVDTGNLVKDQISGKSIIFVDRDASAQIIDGKVEEKFYRGEILYHGSRLIPISSAQGSAMALVFSPDRVTLKEKSQNDTPEIEVECLISLTELGEGIGYAAIIPEDITRL